MSIPFSQFIPPLFLPCYLYICSLCLCLYFCFANRFICTIFLTYTPVLITALFTLARTWKQPKYPLTEEWIKKIWNIHTMEYCLLVCLLSHFSRVWLCATPETAAHQAPPSLGFSRQEHWSGLPFPSPKWKWKVKVKLLSHVRLFATPWTVAC